MSNKGSGLKNGNHLVDALKAIDPKPNSVVFVDASVIDLDMVMESEFPPEYEGILFIPVRVRPQQSLRDAILQMSKEEVLELLK